MTVQAIWQLDPHVTVDPKNLAVCLNSWTGCHLLQITNLKQQHSRLASLGVDRCSIGDARLYSRTPLSENTVRAV